MQDSIIFSTLRLKIRKFNQKDAYYFFELMGNKKVMSPIPLKALTKKESKLKLAKLINLYSVKTEKNIWAIVKKESDDLIGLCGLILNNENENEIAYRFREKYWGFGYGTEIAKGLINYGFYQLHYDLITADVYIKNKKSMKILEKLLIFDKEFYNQTDNCLDRRYKITKKLWVKKMN